MTSIEQRRAAAERRKNRNRSGPHYPHITVALDGTDGNAMALVGKVRRAMDRKGIHDDIVESFVREALSGDYDHVLATLTKWVNVE